MKADFHLHTKADKEFKYYGEESDYIDCYVNALINAKIRLGVIANHNKFDKAEFKKLRRKAKKSGIGLLPGIELSIKDGKSGIHIIVVFSEEWFDNKTQTNHIESFLEQAFAHIPNYQNSNVTSNLNIEQTIEKLDGCHQDYFLIFAHVEQDKGLWKELSPGQIKSIFRDPKIGPRLLGFQKVKTRILKRKIEQQLSNSYPAEVEGCDAKSIDGISNSNKASSYLKLGNLDFKSVKFALRNKQYRVDCKLNSFTHSYITKVKFTGVGSLGKNEINLSPELNTLIGIRGSGKSSILEGIRYVLGINFGDHASDTEYKKDLITHILQSGGVITLNAINHQNQTFQIKRILNENPEVYIEGIRQPGISILETIIRNPVYFGQKDLSNTRKGFEKNLIEKFSSESLVSVRQEIEQVKRQIIEIDEKLKNLEQDSQEIQSLKQEKKDVEYRLAEYQKHGFDSILQKQIDFDRDERKLKQVIQVANDYLSGLNDLLAQNEDELKSQTSFKSEHNEKFIDEFFTVYQELLKNFDLISRFATEGQTSIEQLQSKLTVFQQEKNDLRNEFAEIERGLAGKLKEDGVIGFNSEEFRNLKANSEQLERKIKFFSKSEQRSSELQENLKSELKRLESLWYREYIIIKNTLQKFNKDDSPLKFCIKYKGDKKEMSIHLKKVFKGSRLHKTTLNNVVNQYPDFGNVWIKKDTVQNTLGNSFEKFWETFEANLKGLVTWQVPNLFSIKYYGKSLANHSLGQRASALLLSVLSQEETDVVIIDQPEDDLDNQTIYNDVIKLIRKLKPKTQFIFATHNANFPVLGDAEQIVSCEFLNDQINIKSGSIDCSDLQKRIVDVMEGGTEAFDKRKKVYEDWNPTN